MANPRDESKYGRGHEDGLTPLAPLDPTQTESVDALVRAMSQTAFGGRRLGEAADVLEAMIRDESCFRVVTVSGAMTIAKQGLLLCEMIDRGWVHAIVTTGALMTHGLSEGAGMLHFKHRPELKDEDLYSKGYNRVYDTIELEKNLDDVERILQRGESRQVHETEQKLTRLRQGYLLVCDVARLDFGVATQIVDGGRELEAVQAASLSEAQRLLAREPAVV